MKILIFTEGTAIMHSTAKDVSREKRVKQSSEESKSLKDFRKYIPNGNVVEKLNNWKSQSAEIYYLTSRETPDQLNDVRFVLNKYKFPDTQNLLYRKQGEQYKDVAENLIPDIFIEDDCESIGREEITYPHINPKIQDQIHSIVVKEFAGIDNLPDRIHELIKLKEFKTIMALIKRMQSRYFHAISAFYAYEGMLEIAAPNIVGESNAKENVRIMDKYRNFFVIAQEALQYYFFLELSKLFDASNQSLHINKIVNFTENNLKKLTVDAFKAYNQDRQLLKELTERYKGIEHSDLVVIKDLLDKQKSTIEKLKTYRDSWVAHDDAKKPQKPSISTQEVKDLFNLLKKILNTISGKLNNETWLYHHVEGDVKHHLNSVIDHLRRFEPYRLKEIDINLKKKYKNTLQ